MMGAHFPHYLDENGSGNAEYPYTNHIAAVSLHQHHLACLSSRVRLHPVEIQPRPVIGGIPDCMMVARAEDTVNDAFHLLSESVVDGHGHRGLLRQDKPDGGRGIERIR